MSRLLRPRRLLKAMTPNWWLVRIPEILKGRSFTDESGVVKRKFLRQNRELAKYVLFSKDALFGP
jgi:hypothetical protein